MAAQRYLWIFHASGAKFAGGVFEDTVMAELWIKKHRLSGVLTGNPVDEGCFDWVLRTFGTASDKAKLQAKGTDPAFVELHLRFSAAYSLRKWRKSLTSRQSQRGDWAFDFAQRESARPGLFIRRRRLVPNPARLTFTLGSRRMLHIHRAGEDSIMFGRYLEALAGYRERLPEAVARFASDEERFVLNHPKSLHDAWLESVIVKEARAVADVPSGVEVEVVLLGQRHDRRIRLLYRNVERYNAHAARGEYHDSFHGDLYTHEVRLSEAGHVIHELLFVTGARIEVECSDFEVRDELFTQTA
jgi:hypothetical protein